MIAIEPNSKTWGSIEDWANENLKRARESNDNLTIGMKKTSALRGEIKILKELLALADPPKERRALPGQDYLE